MKMERVKIWWSGVRASKRKSGIATWLALMARMGAVVDMLV
jgi:hypothetical protein